MPRTPLKSRMRRIDHSTLQPGFSSGDGHFLCVIWRHMSARRMGLFWPFERRSILILQVKADKADAVLAPLPKGEPVVWNGDYTLCTQMGCERWCTISLFRRLQ